MDLCNGSIPHYAEKTGGHSQSHHYGHSKNIGARNLLVLALREIVVQEAYWVYLSMVLRTLSMTVIGMGVAKVLEFLSQSVFLFELYWGSGMLDWAIERPDDHVLRAK